MSNNTLSRRMKLGLDLTEARKEINYWTNQSQLRTHPDAKVEARARLMAWQSTAAAIEAELETLQTAH